MGLRAEFFEHTHMIDIRVPECHCELADRSMSNASAEYQMKASEEVFSRFCEEGGAR